MEIQDRNNAEPVVSVIMPAYNAARYLEEAVHSVMEQTFADWELLIIDDCSQDETCAIAEKLAREDSRIRLVRNESNSGAAMTRNNGFSLCTGNYAALLDSDDIWYPEKLERQVQLAEQTGAEIVYCSYGIVDERGNKICDDFIVPEEVTLDSALARMPISCSTALLSREIIQKYRFDPSYYHEDLAFWFQLLKDGHMARGLSEVLADYRVMSGTRASNKVKNAIFRWQVYRHFLKLPFIRSAGLLAQYAVMGLKKYRKR